MAYKTDVNFRMDDLKKQADPCVLPLQVAKRDAFFSAENQAVLKNSLDQYRTGNVQVYDLIEVDE